MWDSCCRFSQAPKFKREWSRTTKTLVMELFLVHRGLYVQSPTLLVGIVVNHYKDPYETTRIQWKGILGTKIPCFLGDLGYECTYRFEEKLPTGQQKQAENPTTHHSNALSEDVFRYLAMQGFSWTLMWTRLFWGCAFSLTSTVSIHFYYRWGFLQFRYLTWLFFCWKLFTTY